MNVRSCQIRNVALGEEGTLNVGSTDVMESADILVAPNHL